MHKAAKFNFPKANFETLNSGVAIINWNSIIASLTCDQALSYSIYPVSCYVFSFPRFICFNHSDPLGFISVTPSALLPFSSYWMASFLSRFNYRVTYSVKLLLHCLYSDRVQFAQYLPQYRFLSISQSRTSLMTFMLILASALMDLLIHSR